jgi:hypothetical protein
MNSADERPNQVTLRALPRFRLKYLEMLVVAVCAIRPWPENLNKKIPTINKLTLLMKEKNIEEKNNKKITKNEKYINLKSSIFFPIQIKARLLNKVAMA